MNTKRKEEWRPIASGRGQYMVSSHGRIKSLKYGKERILRTQPKKDGVHTFVMCFDGTRRYSVTVPRAVADAFLPMPADPRMVAQHVSLDRSDNSLANVRWGYLNGAK